MKNKEKRERLRRVYAEIDAERQICCVNCGARMFLGHSHIIAQKDCEYYGLEFLIFEPENIEIDCHGMKQCHQRWESGDKTLPTYDKRMKYVKRISEEHNKPELYYRYLNKGKMSK